MTARRFAMIALSRLVTRFEHILCLHDGMMDSSAEYIYIYIY